MKSILNLCDCDPLNQLCDCDPFTSLFIQRPLLACLSMLRAAGTLGTCVHAIYIISRGTSSTKAAARPHGVKSILNLCDCDPLNLCDCDPFTTLCTPRPLAVGLSMLRAAGTFITCMRAIIHHLVGRQQYKSHCKAAWREVNSEPM